MHDKRELAQLTRGGLGGGEPLLQTGLVHIFETAGAIAGRQQRVLRFALTVTDSADVTAVLRSLTARGTESGDGGRYRDRCKEGLARVMWC